MSVKSSWESAWHMFHYPEVVAVIRNTFIIIIVLIIQTWLLWVEK